ncbi:MAG: hypothetical protein M1824_005459 [Vezdaea acicularis]|nr:MAG: hypothetical protein M1824_005459 [Vezdaea acicularis]
MVSYLHAFIFLWLYRYVRLIVNCISHWTFKPIPLPEKPSLTPADVTVIIPTILTAQDNGAELRETIRSCLATKPHEIILVTTDAYRKSLSELTRSFHSPCLRVLCVPHANKRRQMCRAIPEVTTEITLFADDDVSWPPTILHWMLAAFEQPDIGGVGTCQRLRRAERPNFWHFLGALYLERRNFEISATTHLDGGISCLSGRSVSYRTKILQDTAFTYGFTHEYWLQKYRLNCDDDNFITRWLVSHGWRTHVQYCPEAELRTTLEENPKFLKQCLRWSRSNWRSNLKSMYGGQVWRYVNALTTCPTTPYFERRCKILNTSDLDSRQQPWSAYALHLATLSPPAFIGDTLLFWLCYRAAEPWGEKARFWTLCALGAWVFLSKFIKLLGHYIRYPEDVILLPVSILFGYLHGIIKVYAFFTLDVTTWGSREGADADDVYRMIRLSKHEK